jgi:nucleotide-binding universal stress UspA family protein
MKTILLATDGSSSAKRATEAAVELARAAGWKLRVVTVWHTLVRTYGYAPVTYAADLSELEREHATSVLEDTAALAREAGVTATSQLREGDAVEEICAAARECDAALLVVGAQGWGPVRRLLFGSVSSGVLHDAPCPVLVVRDEPAAREDAAAAAASSTGS